MVLFRRGHWGPPEYGIATTVGLALSFFAASVPYPTSIAGLCPPSFDHLLGTNEIGQDVLVGLLIATPITFSVSACASILSLAVAFHAAAATSLGNRLVAHAVLRVVDVFQIVPSVLLLLLVAAFVQPGFLGLVGILALVNWSDDVRLLRAILLRECERDSVKHALAMGATWRYCLRRHILPAVWPTLKGTFSQQLRKAAMKVASLGFLGLTDPRLITLGTMMQDATDQLHTRAWLWLLLPPAVINSAMLWIILVVGGRRH